MVCLVGGARAVHRTAKAPCESPRPSQLPPGGARSIYTQGQPLVVLGPKQISSVAQGTFLWLRHAKLQLKVKTESSLVFYGPVFCCFCPWCFHDLCWGQEPLFLAATTSPGARPPAAPGEQAGPSHAVLGADGLTGGAPGMRTRQPLSPQPFALQKGTRGRMLPKPALFLSGLIVFHT